MDSNCFPKIRQSIIFLTTALIRAKVFLYNYSKVHHGFLALFPFKPFGIKTPSRVFIEIQCYDYVMLVFPIHIMQNINNAFLSSIFGKKFQNVVQNLNMIIFSARIGGIIYEHAILLCLGFSVFARLVPHMEFLQTAWTKMWTLPYGPWMHFYKPQLIWGSPPHLNPDHIKICYDCFKILTICQDRNNTPLQPMTSEF